MKARFRGYGRLKERIQNYARTRAKIQKYARLREEGLGPVAIYRLTEEAGESFFGSLNILRKIFGMSLEEAKEISLKSKDGDLTLVEHQESLIPGLREALQERPDGSCLRRSKTLQE